MIGFRYALVRLLHDLVTGILNFAEWISPDPAGER